MKQFYSNPWSLRLGKCFLLFALAFGLSVTSFGQIYKAVLSGPAEQPPNASPGTGNVTVTITPDKKMHVVASFKDLTGTTTASHIHAPTPTAGTGTAGVATTTPTFTGFPLGVKAGDYDHEFDMNLASSYNPAFITANGGTVSSAYAVFKAAMDAGRAYFNIHSTTFPGGEIRGFLVMCPTINVTIPDAFALPQGTLANTVYPAYQPASSLTLSASATGGTGPYSYKWSNMATTSSITVSPTVTTTYTVDVQDQIGCPGMASKTVNVMDISGGKKGDKIVICHKGGNSLTIASPAVADHLQHGDMLGSCGDASMTQRRIGAEGQVKEFTVKASPNPSRAYFDLQLSGSATMQVRVYDLTGRVIESKSTVPSNQTLRIGAFYKPGVYLVEVLQGLEKQTLRLVKE